MGKKHDKKAEPAAGKTPKSMKVDKAVKKFRKLEGKLWTREYLLKIAEFDGATIAPANGAAARADAMGTLAGDAAGKTLSVNALGYRIPHCLGISPRSVLFVLGTRQVAV